MKNLVIDIAVSDYDPDHVAIAVEDENISRFSGFKSQLPKWDWLIDGQIERSGIKSALEFLLLVNSQAFRFWWRRANGSIERYCHEGKTGTMAFQVALRAAWGDEYSPVRLRESGLSEDWLSKYFGNIPAPYERLAIFQEILEGNKLEHAADRLFNVIIQEQSVGVADAVWLASHFPLSYGGDPYLKKAQLMVAAAAGYTSNRGHEVETHLTVFADYQIPRVLRAMGILKYSNDLSSAVARGDLLALGSQEERAIRAATILACESIAEILNIPTAVLDNEIWNSQSIAGNERFHLTETTWY